MPSATKLRSLIEQESAKGALKRLLADPLVDYLKAHGYAYEIGDNSFYGRYSKNAKGAFGDVIIWVSMMGRPGGRPPRITYSLTPPDQTQYNTYVNDKEKDRQQQAFIVSELDKLPAVPSYEAVVVRLLQLKFDPFF